METKNLEKMLEFIEDGIDVDFEKKNVENVKKTLRYDEDAKMCIKFNSYEAPMPDVKWIPTKYTHDDMAAMMIDQLYSVPKEIRAKDSGCYSLRANYGVGTLASVFGAESFFTDENQMPWVRHLEKDKIRQIVHDGKFDIMSGYGRKVIETYEFYNEMLSKYPKCKEVIKLYHADLQGPLDTAHLIYGSDIYYDMYDEEDLVKDFLHIVTKAYIELMDKMKEYIEDETEEFCYHWGTLYRGRIVLRDDTAVNLSADMFNEFVKPYDEMILNHFGSGSIHYCGHKQVWTKQLIDLENCFAVNFGQVPGLTYDMEFYDYVQDMTRRDKKNVIGFTFSTEEELVLAKEKGYDKGNVFSFKAKDLDDIKRIQGMLGI